MERKISNDSFLLDEFVSMGSERFHYRDILRIVPYHLTDERISNIRKVVAGRTCHILPVLDHLYDHMNIHAVIRSAENLGLQAVHIIRSQKMKMGPGRGVSVGSEKWVDVFHWKNAAHCLENLKKKGYQVVATVPPAASPAERPSLPLEEICVDRPLALVFGNEKDGVSESVLEYADIRCHIPSSGFSQSFNISVAAAICFFELLQKRKNQFGIQGDLSPEERDILTARFYMKCLDNSLGIMNHRLNEEKLRGIRGAGPPAEGKRIGR